MGSEIEIKPPLIFQPANTEHGWVFVDQSGLPVFADGEPIPLHLACSLAALLMGAHTK